MPSTTQNTMQAAAIDHFGGSETIKVHTLPMPEVGPEEVLIRVESAGVGVWDPFEREGGFARMFGGEPRFPYVLGSEGAGTVAAVGDRVSGFRPGEAVYAAVLTNPKGGFYAEYTAVPAANVAHIPAKLTIEQAGVMPVDAITALRGLDTLGLKSGETLMIFGASGGIGHLALQFAKRIGARVLAVASGGDGVELARHLGANVVVEGHSDDVVAAARTFADGLDAALVTAGGEATDRALTAMRAGGRVAYPSGVDPEPKVSAGVQTFRYDGILDHDVIQRLNRLVESAPLEVHVAQTYPLEQAAEAQQALERHFVGKLALRPK